MEKIEPTEAPVESLAAGVETLSIQDPSKCSDGQPEDVTAKCAEKEEVDEADEDAYSGSDDDESPPPPAEKVLPEEDRKILEETVDEAELTELHKDWTDTQLRSAQSEALDAKTRGNTLFVDQKYLEAIQTYTEGLKKCPLKFTKDRSVLFFNRGVCKAKLEQRELALKDLTCAVDLDENYFKARLKRAQVYEEAEQLEKALKDYEVLLGMDPRHVDVLDACRRLPSEINERNERLKNEMLSKLKELGNMVLKPFGLSTDNFKFNQDPNTGGYSVNMQK